MNLICHFVLLKSFHQFVFVFLDSTQFDVLRIQSKSYDHLQHQHHHADGDEKLQHRRDKKTGAAIESKLAPEVGLIEDPQKQVSGPVWAKGGIEIESADGSKYETRNRATLCRCGKSKNKPYCDGSHFAAGFNGTETASRKPFSEESVEVVGPELTLSEVPILCSEARFCQRAGDTWSLVKKSDDPECRKIAIEEATDCPSGRIVLKDKDGNVIEPELPPSIGLIEDVPAGYSGPIWVRGGVPIESADGFEYERRNRVTLCRCGHSKNKPFCDGSHLEIKFKSSE